MNTPPGDYAGNLVFESLGGTVEFPFSFVVHQAVLPDDFILHTVHFMSHDPVDLRQDTPPGWWSEEHWRLLENSGRTLKDFGDDYMFTPHIYGANPLISITRDINNVYSFDFTQFDRWIETFLGVGYKGFDGSHMANRFTLQPSDTVYAYDEQSGQTVAIFTTQSGSSAWLNFVGFFYQNLYAHLQQKNWTDIYVQHQVDESTPENTATMYAISKANMPTVETIDAITSWQQNPWDYSPNVDIFVFSIDILPGNQSLVQSRSAEGKKNWCYYFCKPYPPKPGRKLDERLTISRLYPWLCYLYNAEGLLNWAANRFRGADPYASSIGPVPSGSQNPGHPPGDNWVSYPGPDGLRPSMRMVAFREGQIDHTLLVMLAQHDPAKADVLVQQIVRSLTDYESFSPEAYYSVRQSLLMELDQY